MVYFRWVPQSSGNCRLGCFNEPIHTSRQSRTWLLYNQSIAFPWSARSTDMSTVENIWELLRKWYERMIDRTKAWKSDDKQIVRVGTVFLHTAYACPNCTVVFQRSVFL